MKPPALKVVAAWFIISGLGAVTTSVATAMDGHVTVDVRAFGVLLGLGLVWRQMGSWAVAIVWSLFLAVLDGTILGLVVLKSDGSLARLLVHGQASIVRVSDVVGPCVTGTLVSLACMFLLTRKDVRQAIFNRNSLGVAPVAVVPDSRGT